MKKTEAADSGSSSTSALARIGITAAKFSCVLLSFVMFVLFYPPAMVFVLPLMGARCLLRFGMGKNKHAELSSKKIDWRDLATRGAAK